MLNMARVLFSRTSRLVTHSFVCVCVFPLCQVVIYGEENSFNLITVLYISDLHFASSLLISACGFILPVSLCLGTRASSSQRCRAVLLYLNKSFLLQLGFFFFFFPSIPRHYELFAVQSTLIFHSPGKTVDE